MQVVLELAGIKNAFGKQLGSGNPAKSAIFLLGVLAHSLAFTAGGAVRVVLELAGIKNAFGKQLGSGNPLNNARATIEGLRAQRTVQQVAEERGLTVAELMGFKQGMLP